MTRTWILRIVVAVAILEALTFAGVLLIARYPTTPESVRSLLGLILTPGVFIAERVLRGGVNAGPGFLSAVAVGCFVTYCGCGLLIAKILFAFRGKRSPIC